MLNKNRIIKKIVNIENEDVFAERMHLAFPRLHEVVDQFDFQIDDAEQLDIYKLALSSALRRVRNFFVETGIASNTDFTDAVFAMFAKNRREEDNKNDFLKFSIMKNINSNESAGHMDQTKLDLKANTRFITREKISLLEDILIHELFHYFNQCFDVKYIENGNIITVASNPRVYKDGDPFIKTVVSRNSGKREVVEDNRYFTTSTFLIEGYTQLATELIKPNGSKSYEPQVKMMELLQYVSGAGYDLTDFMHLDTSKITASIGKSALNEFVRHCDIFHNRYYENDLRTEDQISFVNDKNYIKAQNILIETYFEKLGFKYRGNFDVAGCARDLVDFINYIPVINEGMAEFFAIKLGRFVGYNINSDPIVKKLLIETFDKQLELNGAPKNIASTKNVCIDAFWHEESGFGISIMGKNIDLDEKHVNVYVDEDHRANVKTYSNISNVFVYNTKNGEDTDYIKVVVDRDSRKIDTFDEATKKKVSTVEFSKGDKERAVRQNLSYLENISTAKRLKREFEKRKLFNDATNISLLKLKADGSGESAKLVLLDNSEGERFFFYDDGKNLEMIPIEDIKRCRTKTVLCSGLFVEKNSSGQHYLKKLAEVDVKREFILSGESIFEKDFTVRELQDTLGKTTFSYFNGKHDVELKPQEIFDAQNPELMRAWEGETQSENY